MLNKSILLATEAHKGQVRKNSGLPYITHPLAVMQTLIDYGVTDQETLAIAVLHDVPEDCDAYFTEQLVCDDDYDDMLFVDIMSLAKERTQKLTAQKLSTASYRSQLVKLADIEHNTREGEIYPGYFDKKLLQLHAMEKVAFHPLADLLFDRFLENKS